MVLHCCHGDTTIRPQLSGGTLEHMVTVQQCGKHGGTIRRPFVKVHRGGGLERDLCDQAFACGLSGRTHRHRPLPLTPASACHCSCALASEPLSLFLASERGRGTRYGQVQPAFMAAAARARPRRPRSRQRRARLCTMFASPMYHVRVALPTGKLGALWIPSIVKEINGRTRRRGVVPGHARDAQMTTKQPW